MKLKNWNWNWKIEIEIENWNWKLKLKLKIEIEINYYKVYNNILQKSHIIFIIINTYSFINVILLFKHRILFICANKLLEMFMLKLVSKMKKFEVTMIWATGVRNSWKLEEALKNFKNRKKIRRGERASQYHLIVTLQTKNLSKWSWKFKKIVKKSKFKKIGFFSILFKFLTLHRKIVSFNYTETVH